MIECQFIENGNICRKAVHVYGDVMLCTEHLQPRQKFGTPEFTFQPISVEGGDLTIHNPEPKPRLFTIIRNNDESGVSGTGRVLDGVLWHNGKVTICWRTDIEKPGMSSVSTFDTWKAFMFIHVDSHPTNKTEIKWL